MVIANEYLQGNGYWKYIRCHCPLLLWWILDVLGHYFHPRWIQHNGRARGSGWGVSFYVL